MRMYYSDDAVVGMYPGEIIMYLTITDGCLKIKTVETNDWDDSWYLDYDFLTESTKKVLELFNAENEEELAPILLERFFPNHLLQDNGFYKMGVVDEFMSGIAAVLKNNSISYSIRKDHYYSDSENPYV